MLALITRRVGDGRSHALLVELSVMISLVCESITQVVTVESIERRLSREFGKFVP
jgi:hypothetical protein